jgi:hypothetical protein
MGTGEGAAVFERASRFNHCCLPNACFAWNEKLGVETIYAIKEIESGEVSQVLQSGWMVSVEEFKFGFVL